MKQLMMITVVVVTAAIPVLDYKINSSCGVSTIPWWVLGMVLVVWSVFESKKG